MIIIKQITKVIEEVDDILCNKCGKSLKGECDFEGLIEAEAVGGYGSILGDMCKYKFSLCENCLKELFENFKYSALVIEESYV